MDRGKTCCFTGHRPGKLPWGDDEEDPRCLELRERLQREVELAYDQGFHHFLCGMAQGADLLFCGCVQRLRDDRPGVTLEAAVPWEGQADRWSGRDRERYQELLGLCDYETVIQKGYDRNCYLRRNRYMVDRSGLVIAVYDGSPGGSGYTVTYAVGRGVRVVLLDPGKPGNRDEIAPAR